ncbi:tripartite tricarboxylate transporter substrate binding protein [Paracidovorax wautersii]|uniref:Bug family tripartite tricarboxylate transporter substrate binding protein n=1 Tax=Paracidovorax wautersii TaxID=1177982 RepID=UPI0031DDC8CE
MTVFQLIRRAAAAIALAVPLLSPAQDSGTTEWVVGYAAGGGSDALARTLAEQMGKTMGRTIIVNNKPGGATNIAADYVAKSKAQDRMLFTADFATLAANPWLFSRLPFDPDRDFKSVGLLGRFPLVLVVGPQVPATGYREFLAWAKARKTPVSFASSGIGSPQHLAGELFRERTGLNLQHVPYRGGALAVQDLIGGQVDMALMDSATVVPHLQGGRLRALGVASMHRVQVLPGMPTLAEQGLADFEAFAWQGLVVPAGASADQVAALNTALQKALASEPVKARLQALAIEPMPGTPAQMNAYVKAERARWGAVIKAANVQLD